MKIKSFTLTEMIAYEEGVTRRDPSPIIKVKETYYVWYTKTAENYEGYTGSIWFATSYNGIKWREQGLAVPKGEKDSFDEHGVFTPSILISDNMYYLSYTAVPNPFITKGSNLTKTAIGMAVSSSPEGPWVKLPNPILTTSDDVLSFDSFRVDDTCFVLINKKYYMYYKGRQLDLSHKETKMGVAISDSPQGPYVKYKGNPILDSGHEVCVWPNNGGVYSLVSDAGPQGNTLQYSEDGLKFNLVLTITPPKAPGPYRDDNFTDGMNCNNLWGSCMSKGDGWPYLLRYDITE